MNKGLDEGAFGRNMMGSVKNMPRKTIDEATPQQIFQAVAYAVRDVVIDKWTATHKEYEKEDTRIVYYLPMKSLMGRTLGSNIINICVRNEIKEALDEMGFDLNVTEDQEPDAALRNGSLGRLTAYFLDSLATLGYPAYGCGIHYHYGMFKQKIKSGYQVEAPDNWLKDGNPFEIRRSEYASEIKFGGYMRIENRGGVNHFVQDGYQSVRVVPCGPPIIGYGNSVVNILHIWDAESTNTFNSDSLSKGDYRKAVEQGNLAKTIVEVLYLNDDHYTGKELRLKQRYFFVSVSVQRTVEKHKEKYDNIRKLYEKVVFQLDNTHPMVTIPKLMQILLDEGGPTWNEAWEIVARTCACTSHTIMSEVLEKWFIELFSQPLPRTYQIVGEINRRFQNQIQTMYPGNQEKLRKMFIIYDGQVEVTYMAIIASFSVNGVARLHTEVLKHQELKDSHEMMPGKFSNKTNSIARGQLLLHNNPLLADWVASRIDDEWVTDLLHIKELELFVEDEKCQFKFMNVKYQNKLRLARCIKGNSGTDTDPRLTLDVQVKRSHEYKRQLMNIFHVMYLYNQLKDNPDIDAIPETFIFGAKVAEGYKRAKLTIKLINSMADVIDDNKPINGKIKVVFIEDYRVSNVELIFMAADISEQISAASKGAPGTSNMRLMLDGALTLGTMDGASVEIVEEVGADNAFIFDMPSDEVINYESNGGYYPVDTFNNDQEICRVLMQLTNRHYASDDPELFRDTYSSLLNTKSSDRADTYLILKDPRSYAKAHQRVDKVYRDQTWWAKAAILNTASCGKSTSDRTIEEYVKDIQYLKKVTVEV